MLPLVSVVIPTFNYGHLVGEAVDSVLAQTYRNIEIVVVDDGSTDNTREQLAKYGEGIQYHYQPNAGLSAARNMGIALAKGELIAFLDSDDAFHPEKLTLQVRYLAEHPEVALVATDLCSDALAVWRRLPEDTGNLPVTSISLRDAVIRASFAPSSVLVRRDCLDRVGLFDPALSPVADRDLWIRIAAKNRLAKIMWPLTWYRQTPGSMSRNAVQMERCERMAIEKAFSMPELSNQTLLKRSVIGLAETAAARRYQACGQYGIAVARVLSSFVAWPFPFRKQDGVVAFGRARLMFAILRQALGIRLDWAVETHVTLAIGVAWVVPAAAAAAGIGVVFGLRSPDRK